MTLRELGMLVKKFWALMLVIVIVGSMLGFGYALMKNAKPLFTATAQIVAASDVNSVAGFAENVKRDMQSELQAKSVTVDISNKSTNMMTLISASGPYAPDCIDAANTIANTTNEIAMETYAQREESYIGNVSLAVEASSAPSNATKFVAFGCMAGVFVALVVVLLIDLKRRYVKTVESVQKETNLPVLDVIPSSSGDKLVANVRFAANRLGITATTLRLLIVPVGNNGTAAEVEAQLTSELSGEIAGGIQASTCPPLSETMEGAYASRDADLVVVAVSQWADTLPSLISCVDELEFAEAKIAGLVFCKEAKHHTV